MSNQLRASRWYYPLRWVIVLVLGLIIYGQTFGYGFVFDDNPFIVINPYIKSFDQVHHMWKVFPQTRTIGFYSFAFNYAINQLNPQGYHIFNFIIHLTAVALVWATAGILFRMAGLVPSNDWLRNEIPFIIAILFLVHPCQTQAVSYITQRFESMATVFYLASIYCYLRARQAVLKTRKILLFLFCVGFAILGIYTKEVAATIPLMILGLEWIFFMKKTPFWKIGIVVAGGGMIFFILFTKLVRTDLNIFFHWNPIPSESHDGEIITVKSYLLTQMHVFFTFIRILLLPIQQTLDYDYPLSKGLLNPPLTLIGLCLITFSFASIFKYRKQYPIIAFGLAWILITFSINLAPRANVIFEHKLYLISFGFFLILVNLLFLFIRQRTLLGWVLISMITILSVLAVERNQVWQNDSTLWDDVILKSPHKARAFINHGQTCLDLNDITQALSDFNKAIEINPTSANAYYNRGIVYNIQGNFTQALMDFNKAIDIKPDYVEAYNNRGNLFEKQSKYSQALSDYNKAIEIDPVNNALSYNNRGGAYDRMGNIAQAILDFSKAIEITPSLEQAYGNRGQVYYKQGNYTQALSDYNKAIELNPKDADSYSNRALVYYYLKKYDLSWEDVHQVQGLGVPANPQLIQVLKQATNGTIK